MGNLSPLGLMGEGNRQCDWIQERAGAKEEVVPGKGQLHGEMQILQRNSKATRKRYPIS